MPFIRFFHSVSLAAAIAAALFPAAALAEARAENSAKTPFFGRWQIISINGKAAIAGDRGAPEIEFKQGKVSGKSGCNSFGGSLKAKGAKVKFSAPAATMMACPEPLMRQEQALFQALSAAEVYRPALKPAGHKAGKMQAAAKRIAFVNAAGRSVLVLQRQ